uniref:histidine kinase n=1 Tax=Candidatus Kentrum sp. LFY TaxID=2126342 RepID=A0A450UDF3_9GAMM|nr:MAG: Response regulator receiver domain-containing protein [Candidatus Kentron sp. LFY]
MTDSSPSPSSPADKQTEFIGQIPRARIKKVRLQSCDLELLDSEANSIADGRLYQAESLAWKDSRPLADIPEYQRGNFLDAVFVRRLRHEEGRPLWYVHERWGEANPWENLSLKQDDVVTGTVTRTVSIRDGEHIGYLVQLDVGSPIQIDDSGVISPCERIQPDIQAFLPNEEVPWNNGDLEKWPSNNKEGRLSLEIGDPIQALVLEIRFPPRNPMVSVTRLIHRRDGAADKTIKHRDNLARWRFWRFFGETKTEEASEAHQFTPNDAPYAGRHLLLVDDDPRTLAAQSELLNSMGAEIQTIQVRRNGFSNAVTEVTAALRKGNVDLVLIDNNLPGRDLGQTLIGRVHARLGGEHAACFALITANDERVPTGDAKVELCAKGVIGFVQRPLSHSTLQRLLVGEEVWEEAKSTTDTLESTQYSPETKVSPTLQETLKIMARQPGIHFTVLIKAKRQIEIQDLIVAGTMPFAWDEYPEVLRKTDLPLLIEGRISNLKTLPKEGGNELLRISRNGHSHWQILELGTIHWIFGVGYDGDRDIETELPLWHGALATALDAQGWRSWARHVSSFVQLGLAHQALSHEVIHPQDEFRNLLRSLDRWIEKLQSGQKLTEKDRKYLVDKVEKLTQSNARLLEFSQRQLREQALRHREVSLVDAAKTIQRIVNAECREAEVTLHMIDPPPLALPLPHAALVLPVVNLLLNATKHHYRQENRRVELLFDMEEIAKGRPMLLIDVRDNGPGLDRGALERLWQPGFSQATDPDRRHGIGLWLSRQLVEEAGGKLDLHENWRGIGACFRLRFPIHLG